MVRTRIVLSLLALSVFTALSGCASAPPEGTSGDGVPPATDATSSLGGEDSGSSASNDVADPSQIAWLDTELTDAVTGDSIRISDYRGKPVLLHAFAVW